jgi:adenylate cyclase
MPKAPSGGEEAILDIPINRRLAAVAFVDIVGYSILMARDEARTHRRWMRILADVIRPEAAHHRGNVVKSTGDGVLVEFSSAIDAVEWSLKVQRAVAPMVDDPDASMPLSLRIAVHLCEVIETEDDIYGDGVNIAARLQEHAEPGGIVLSDVVHDVARAAVGSKVRDLGFLMLKHIEHPVHAYALDPETPGLAVPARPPRKERPSIAVLPLQNLGGNPEDDYFADGVVEDIIVSLAALRELLVIARASTLIYRGQHPDLRLVARSLGVRYVLMGSIRRTERSVRVSTELCDAVTGASLWGDKSEVAPGELFDVQDRIVARIVAGIAPHVRQAELSGALRKRPESFTAYDHMLRALDIMNNLDPRTFGEAREYLNRAIAEDPNFAMPVAWAARWHSIHVGQGWSTSPDEDAAKAAQLAGKAIELDQQNALALAT